MKILFVGHNATYTGAPKSLLRIMRYMNLHQVATFDCLLRNTGPLLEEYKAVCTVHEYLPDSLIPKNGQVFRNLYRAVRLRLHRKRLIKRLRACNYDLIYSNTVVNANVLEYLSQLNLPVVAHLREMNVAIDGYGGRPMIEIMNKHVKKFISVSDRAGKVLASYGVPKEKIVVVHNFLEPVEFEIDGHFSEDLIRRELGLPTGSKLVGNVGTFNLRKGCDVFIKTAEKVMKSNRAVHFLWIGALDNGLKDKLTAGWSEDLLNRLHLIGEVPHPYRYYKIMDVFFLSSMDDPFPLTAMEAAYYRKPVVCFEGTGGIPEVLNHQNLVIPKYSEDAALEIITPLLASNQFAVELGMYCEQVLVEQLTIDQQMGKIVSIIDSVLSDSDQKLNNH